MEKDPERMCKTIRHETAFRFAYSNIKPGDAAIVGMYPNEGSQIQRVVIQGLKRAEAGLNFAQHLFDAFVEGLDIGVAFDFGRQRFLVGIVDTRESMDLA